MKWDTLNTYNDLEVPCTEPSVQVLLKSSLYDRVSAGDCLFDHRDRRKTYVIRVLQPFVEASISDLPPHGYL